MSETINPIPDEILEVWNNLSLQMQAHIKAFGVEPAPLTRESFTDGEWRNLSPQLRARIISRSSMDVDNQAQNS